MKNYISIAFIFAFGFLQSQVLLDNEETVFSFKTNSNKTMTLAKDTAYNYIVYRFGTESNTELEIMDSLNDANDKFFYSFIFRGGGTQNEGIDLNWVYFDSKDFRYVIFDEYTADGDTTEFGIYLINLKTNKKIVIKGKPETDKGALVTCRFDELLPVSEIWFK